MCRSCEIGEEVLIETDVPGVIALRRHADYLAAEYEFWKDRRRKVGRLLLFLVDEVLCVRLIPRGREDWERVVRSMLAALASDWPYEELDFETWVADEVWLREARERMAKGGGEKARPGGAGAEQAVTLNVTDKEYRKSDAGGSAR
jgi:hypothetical protein